MRKKVQEYMKQHHMIEEHDKVIVGVSGGPDSVCLLVMLLELQQEVSFDLVVVHVNHGLRGETALRDETYVRLLCEKHKIPFEIVHADVGEIAKRQKKTLEEAGRDVRRKAFYDAMEKYCGTKIALAHHKNDNVETFLMNLARGTGLKGLAGMQPVNGKLIRPLLCLDRKEIEQYLQEKHIEACIDETNASNTYTRNRIRNQILPLLEEGVNAKSMEHISETMELLGKVEAYVEEETKRYYEATVREQGDEMILLQEPYEKLPQLFQAHVVQEAMIRCAKQSKDLQKSHISAVMELMGKQTGRKISLPYNLEAKKCYEGILLSKRQEKQKRGQDVEVRWDMPEKLEISGNIIRIQLSDAEDWKEEKKYTKCFDCGIMNNALRVRTRMPGDYITIDESGNRQKLKSYFINEKIPQEERDHILLLAEGNHVLWVIGYRRGCAYYVQPHSKQHIRITIEKGESNGRKN